MGGKIGAVLIAGPTASGKSALALDLARERNGVVVNADSMQVYRDLRVLTARPTPEEEAEAPHRLYGHVDGAVNYSVGHYLRDAAAVLDEVRHAGRLPILVSGTGLYFRALIEGLSEIPPVPAAIRDRARAAAEGRASEELHAELASRDPDSAARLRPSDRLRILRALEVLEATDRPLVSFQGRKSRGALAEVSTARIFLAPDRDLLRKRIDARFLAMIKAGALDEVKALAARGLDPMLPVVRAHGVPGLLAHLRGEILLEDAVARGQADTRRYAKRQFTWFRHQMPGWRWIAPEEGRETVLAALDQSRREGAS
jgi:tRNA dimethylallyltransferase